MKTNISDDEIEKAFAGANFGDRDHRKLLEQGVLKKLGGYRSGATLTGIMIDLGLISKINVLKKGRMFLMDSFYDCKNTG